MRDGHFGFRYTWTDLAPIRGLVAFVFVAQVVGLGLGALFPRFPSLLDSAWFGGALATFPAFVRTKRPSGVYLRADGRVAYGSVVQVLAVIRAAGVQDVGLVAEPETITR